MKSLSLFAFTMNEAEMKDARGSRVGGSLESASWIFGYACIMGWTS
jgi:hypothetical protein